MLLRLVDPEFEQTPVYLFDRREVDNDLCTQCGYRAYTGVALDLELAEPLMRSGQWRGRGFCAVFDIDHFRVGHELYGCVLHEAAHFLEAPRGIAVSDPVAAYSEIEQLLTTMSAQVKPVTRKPPAWSGHGKQYVRTAAHLAHRVGSFARQITPEALQFGERFYGPEFTEYEWIDSLSDEIERSTGKPLRAVLKTAAPAEFNAMWNSATRCKNYSASVVPSL